MTLKVLIAGGGIGGLTAALCLVARGFEVRVLERAARLEAVGAGIQLSPNAMRVYRALGLEAAVRAAAFEPQALEMRLGQSGQSVFSIPAGAAAQQRWGAPYLHIYRPDLIAVLADRLNEVQAGCLQTSAGVVEWSCGSPDGEGVQGKVGVRLEGGKDGVGGWDEFGDVLVGADGIHSMVRTRMLGPEAPRFTGNVAWRAVVDIERLGDHAPPPTACVWVGAGRHAVTYRLAGGRLANFVGVVERADWREESWTGEGTRAQALADFSGWHKVVTSLIEAADTHYRWALFDRAPLPRWTHGPVALLGDACHPMLPFMAQGAAMAIEDGYVLARCLSEQVGNPAAALQTYEGMRRARTSRVQAAARGNMGTFHRRTALARVSTYGPMWMAGRFMPGFVNARQDWIYGHDVTA